MAKNLVRYQEAGHLHFITFSCYLRQPFLADAAIRELFERSLETTRVRYDFFVTAYVVMPEHVHLLSSEPKGCILAKAIQALKLSVSVQTSEQRFWQRRYYDFNVYTEDKLVEKRRYIHRNPVSRGLVTQPEDWKWSSFRHWWVGEEGTVEIESTWTARRRRGLGMRIDPVTGTHPLCGESIDVGHPPNPSGGFSYDAAGNITTDNFGQSYTYDAEGRIATEGSTTYKYDAEGQLVYENGSHGTQAFLRNSSGQAVSIYNPSGGSTPYSVMYAYIDGQKIGSWQPDVFHFTGQDGLGTKRYESGGYGDLSSGTNPIVQTSFTSLPFGDMQTPLSSTDPTHFTGKERDIESGNDYFGARYYSSSTGRFMSPDDGSDQDPSDPQSWNLYSYVRNNPISNTDPTGNACVGGVDDGGPGETCAQVDAADKAYIAAGKSSATVTADWGFVGSIAAGVGNIAQQAGDALSYASQQVSDAVSQIDLNRLGCIGNGMLAGGIAGAGTGAVVGLAGGPAAEFTVPSGALLGSGLMATAGGMAAMSACPGGGGGRASGSSARLTKPQQRQTAKHLGMKEVKGSTSQGQAIFEKDGRYFSFSNTSHTEGEVFKEVDRNGNRIATTDLNLNRIGP